MDQLEKHREVETNTSVTDFIGDSQQALNQKLLKWYLLDNHPSMGEMTVTHLHFGKGRTLG